MADVARGSDDVELRGTLPLHCPRRHHEKGLEYESTGGVPHSRGKSALQRLRQNKLVPELVPSAVDLVSAWLVELGLDASIMTDDDAKDAAIMRARGENHRNDELNEKAPCYYPFLGTRLCSGVILVYQY